MPDLSNKILLDARIDSVLMEGGAVSDLERNVDGYLEPSWTARKMLQGYRSYVDSCGKNNEEDYYTLRDSFSETKGKSHRVFANVLAQHVRSVEYDYTKSIYEFNDAENIIKTGYYHLKHHGFYKTPFIMPDSLLERLKKKVLSGLNKDHGDDVDNAILGTKGAPRQLKTNANWLSSCEEIFEFSADPILLGIVQRYLGVPPIFSTPVAFLNSTVPAANSRSLSDTAQQYHHDMHRMRFVKVFVYLTDVDEDSGPHTLIPGTHRNRPDSLWADGRHTDAAVKKEGILDKESRILGKKGTIFLVDTTLLHKGSEPKEHWRLLAQVQYNNSLFGRPLAASDNKVQMVHSGSTNGNITAAYEHVIKYIDKTGIRFMQGYI